MHYSYENFIFRRHISILTCELCVVRDHSLNYPSFNCIAKHVRSKLPSASLHIDLTNKLSKKQNKNCAHTHTHTFERRDFFLKYNYVCLHYKLLWPHRAWAWRYCVILNGDNKTGKSRMWQFCIFAPKPRIIEITKLCIKPHGQFRVLNHKAVVSKTFPRLFINPFFSPYDVIVIRHRVTTIFVFVFLHFSLFSSILST